jgi:hypothetical protein
MSAPTLPNLALRFTDRGWAICGRCEELIGRDTNGLTLVWPPRGMGWVLVNHGYFEFVLRRRRRDGRAMGPVGPHGNAEVLPGSVVVCPNRKCNARQVVPRR